MRKNCLQLTPTPKKGLLETLYPPSRRNGVICSATKHLLFLSHPFIAPWSREAALCSGSAWSGWFSVAALPRRVRQPLWGAERSRVPAAARHTRCTRCARCAAPPSPQALSHSSWCLHTRCCAFFRLFHNCRQNPCNQKNNRTHNGPVSSLISSTSCLFLLRENLPLLRPFMSSWFFLGPGFGVSEKGCFLLRQRAALGPAAAKSRGRAALLLPRGMGFSSPAFPGLQSPRREQVPSRSTLNLPSSSSEPSLLVLSQQALLKSVPIFLTRPLRCPRVDLESDCQQFLQVILCFSKVPVV